MMNIEGANNERVPMTRRFPNLPKKVLRRDSQISLKLISAWDNEHDVAKVLSIYQKEIRNLSDERYWEFMRSVWIIAGSVSTAPFFRKLMTAKRKHSYYFSTPEEAKKLRALPETFDIYRATNDENDGGLSWTLSKDYAEWYKQVFDKANVICRTVNRKDIFAFIERNNEAEIILL